MPRLRIETFAGTAFALLAFVAPPALATNLVVNGDFESGNTGFTSAYHYSPGFLYGAGSYDVASDPAPENKGWSSFAAHGGSLMMLINGADTPGVNVWSESAIPVAPDTTYYFSTWIASTDSIAPAKLAFSANGSPLGSVFTAGNAPGMWQEFFASWYSGSASDVTLSLLNQNTAFSGNDFALDDVSLSTLAPGGIGVGGTVPEPAGVALLGTALAGFVLIWRWRKA